MSAQTAMLVAADELGWSRVERLLPREFLEVLTFHPTRPYCTGYFGREDGWRDSQGLPIRVSHWRCWPPPPSD